MNRPGPVRLFTAVELLNRITICTRVRRNDSLMHIPQPRPKKYSGKNLPFQKYFYDEKMFVPAAVICFASCHCI